MSAATSFVLAWAVGTGTVTITLGAQKKDLAGKTFGRLTPTSRAPNRCHEGKAWWHCVCLCGNKVTCRQAAILSGSKSSCGCLKRESSQRTIRIAQGRVLKHGMSRTPTYNTYQNMLKRCRDPSDTHYHAYGGRGIKVCLKWRTSFSAFLADMGPKPPGMSIDRIDNDGDYEPGNCRWATSKEQARNTSRTIPTQFKGHAVTLQDVHDATGINRDALYRRIVNKGMTGDEAVKDFFAKHKPRHYHLVRKRLLLYIKPMS